MWLLDTYSAHLLLFSSCYIACCTKTWSSLNPSTQAVVHICQSKLTWLVMMLCLYLQVHFSLIDLELHARFTPGQGESVFDRDAAVASKTMVMPHFPEDRFLCSFSHIFAGGYSAGYYSYKWAEVLSADAFSAFEDAGLDNESAVKETGERFRDTVLALGGSVAPLEVSVGLID